MATKRAKTEALRGEALVEKVIARVEAGKGDLEVSDARPIAPAKLKKLKFSNGKPLPPSLQRWLAYDGGWLMRTLGWPSDLDEPVLKVSTVAQLVKKNISDVFHNAFKKLPKPLPQADAIALDVGSESMRYLFLCEPDDAGEYPVLDLDVDDMPVIGFVSAGFDTWLAEMSGLKIDDAVHAAARKRLFGKKEELECTDFAEADEDEDEDEDEEEVEEAPKPKKQAAKPAKPFEVKAGLPEDKLGKALAEAIESGDEPRVDAYLAAAKERFPKAQVWGPLAVRQITHGSDAALAKRLFEAGASADAVGPYGAHFQTAASYASLDVITAFLEAGATLDRRSSSSKSTALIGACDKKRVEVVKLLLDRGADPNVVDDNKMGPIHHATHVFDPDVEGARKKSVEILRMLLERGAELDRQDGNKRSALHWAIEENNMPAFELLVERKPDPNAKQWAGDTALTLAHRHKRTAMYAPLLALGARTDIKNDDGWCVDDIAGDQTGPKSFDVRFSTAPGRHTAKLELEVSFTQAMMGADLLVLSLMQLAGLGCAGSDVFPPWVCQIELKGGGLPTYGKGSAKWDASYEGIAPAAFAMWMRRLLGSPHPFTVLKMSFVGDGETTIDTDRARSWLADGSLEPYGTWREPGFAVVDGAPDPKCLARVVTKKAIPKDRLNDTVLWLQINYGALPQRNPNKPSNAALEATNVSPKGFDIGVRWFEKKGVFPWDVALARAYAINALAKLHHEHDAIERVEWTLAV